MDDGSGVIDETREVRTYDDLVAALIARRHALKWSQAELDQRAGFQDGYSAKLERFDGPQGRVAGAMALPLWMETLGISFLVVDHAPTRAARERLAEVERPRVSGADLARRPRLSSADQVNDTRP